MNIAIAGVSGYTGQSLLHILIDYPGAQITHLYTSQHDGRSITDLFPYLHGRIDISLEKFDPKQLAADIDVLFLALPHNTSHQYMSDCVSKDIKVIDLSADFRFLNSETFNSIYGTTHQSPKLLSEFVYGIPELYRSDIAKSDYCAVPGCYANTIILGLSPLASSKGLTQSVFIDAKSGVSGAGKGLKESSLFCEVHESTSAYATGAHRHIAELQSHLKTSTLTFSPHLVPQNRGIIASMYMENIWGLSQSDVTAIYNDAYHNEIFITVDESMVAPSTKYVSGTNQCLIVPKVLPDTNAIVVFSLTDNLLKGAASLAVQNMNLMVGQDETTGLLKLPNTI